MGKIEARRLARHAQHMEDACAFIEDVPIFLENHISSDVIQIK